MVSKGNIVRFQRNSSVPKPATARPARHAMACECGVCINKYATNRIIREPYSKDLSTPLNKSGFPWLLEQISNSSLHIDVTLKVPETSVWKDGVPKFILRFFGNKFKKQTDSKINPHFILVNFNSASGDDTIRKPSRQSSRVSVSSSSRRLSTKNLLGAVSAPDCNYFKAILRENIEGVPEFHQLPARLLSEKELFNILSTWTREQLRKIQLLQAYTKVTGGKPSVIRVHLIDPLSFQPKLSSKYGHNKPQNDITRVRAEKCKEICREICKNLFTTAKIEITELRAEFMTSDTEYLLNDVWDISWRKVESYGNMKEEYTCYAMNTDTLFKLDEKLSTKELRVNREKMAKLNTLCSSINKHVKDMRETSGVNNGLAPEPMDTRSNRAFSALRPYCPYPLTELIKPKFNFARTSIKGITPEAKRLPNEKLVRALLFEEERTMVRKSRQIRAKTEQKMAGRQITGEGTFGNTRESTEGLITDIRTERGTTKQNKRFLFEPTNWFGLHVFLVVVTNA